MHIGNVLPGFMQEAQNEVHSRVCSRSIKNIIMHNTVLLLSAFPIRGRHSGFSFSNNAQYSEMYKIIATILHLLRNSTARLSLRPRRDLIL